MVMVALNFRHIGVMNGRWSVRLAITHYEIEWFLIACAKQPCTDKGPLTVAIARQTTVCFGNTLAYAQATAPTTRRVTIDET